jgi:mono/diheme cytochrome c family protein
MSKAAQSFWSLMPPSGRRWSRYRRHTETTEGKLKRICHRLACAAILIASTAVAANAADATNGERIAQNRCAVCHIVTAPNQRRDVADAPPFEAIARKFDFNADMLVFHLLEPHPKMNFPLTRPEANDVAAYMSTLAR